MEKVLFLDVDGVLNAVGTKNKSPHGTYGVDPERAKILDRIVDQTGCYIVLSSTWRKYPDLVAYLFGTLSPATRSMIVSKTPVFSNGERGDEIREWLDSNPGVKTFAILDDDADMGSVLPFLVQTHPFEALTDEIADRVIKMLNTPVEPDPE